MYIIGISAYYHDSSACLFKDDKLLFACEEEKFTGIKHDSSFPKKTIEYIFKHYNLTKDDIEAVCYYENPKLRFKRKKSFFTSLQTNLKVWWNLRKISKNIHYTPHHMSHMAYAYLSSNFDKSVIVSIDGVGETATICFGKGVGGSYFKIKDIDYPHSLGLFYSAMTAFLGFKPNEGEYKVMGLAAYGNPEKYRQKVKQLINFDNLTLTCNLESFNWNRSDDTMFTHNLIELLGIENRMPNEPITDDHKDLAASVQERYEELFFQVIKDAQAFFYSENLSLGGGCAYNGCANGKVIEKGLFKKLWVPPAPSDAGSCIGSCLDYLVNVKKLKVRIPPNPFLGPAFTDNEIQSVLNKYGNKVFYRKHTKDKLIDRAAHYLNLGLVVGWFQDNIEFGARALGNRSILANPTLPKMQEKINKVIKKREGFRPFAPMVIFEQQDKYFQSREFIPYMNQVVKVRPEHRDKLPAVTHVDGTARVQSVLPNNMIYQLLKEFERQSGYPILLNTSFNVKDKTMVLTPEDAILTYLDTAMDILVIGEYIIYKNDKTKSR